MLEQMTKVLAGGIKNGMQSLIEPLSAQFQAMNDMLADRSIASQPPHRPQEHRHQDDHHQRQRVPKLFECNMTATEVSYYKLTLTLRDTQEQMDKLDSYLSRKNHYVAYLLSCDVHRYENRASACNSSDELEVLEAADAYINRCYQQCLVQTAPRVINFNTHLKSVAMLNPTVVQSGFLLRLLINDFNKPRTEPEFAALRNI